MKKETYIPCEQGWQALSWDPMTWLLDDCGPGVRWRTLRELVGRPPESPAVVRARGGASAAEPVASLLAGLQPDGSWYLTTGPWSRFRGAGWRLVSAVHLGADTGDPSLRAGASALLAATDGEGGLDPMTCISARGLQALAELGQARDPRFEEALAWIEAEAGPATGPVWTCPFHGHRGPQGGCVVTAVAILGLLLAAPDHRRLALRDRAVAVLDRVMSEGKRPQHLFRYGNVNLMRTDAAEIFQVLARSGITFESGWRQSMHRLQNGQDGRGRWALGQASPASLRITSGGEIGRPSAWATLRAATALMHYAVAAGLPRLFPRPVGSQPARG